MPPSTWSANSSFRRRNPSNQASQYVSNHRLKKYNNRNQNGYSSNDPVDNSQHQFETTNDSEVNSYKNQFELTIRESEEEETQNKNSNFNHGNDVIEQIDEKVETTINKDNRFKDFGFTITSSLHGNGIYVSKIRHGCDAEQNYYLKPATKIFKINNYDCTKIDLAQANKILTNEQSMNSSIKLVISKRPKNVLLNEEITEKRNHSSSLEDKLNGMGLQNSYGMSTGRATAL